MIKSVEEMTFSDRVDWVTQMAFEGLIRDGTQGMRNDIWLALSSFANIDAQAGSRWALAESGAPSNMKKRG